MEDDIVVSGEDGDVDLVKRYLPIGAVGTFLCSNCIVEAAKSYVLDEFPEIMQIETHLNQDDEENINFITQTAMRCMLMLVKKFKPTNDIVIIDAGQLMNTPAPGSLFIGRNYDAMKPDETKQQFIENTKIDLMNLHVFNHDKFSFLDNLTKETEEQIQEREDEHEHELDLLEISSLIDCCIYFSPKETDDDQDDIDVGYADGMSDGIDSNDLWVKVALYKMYKNKKIKNLDYLIEEIHNTIAGMDSDDFVLWSNNFAKYMEKRKIRLERLEKGEE